MGNKSLLRKREQAFSFAAVNPAMRLMRFPLELWNIRRAEKNTHEVSPFTRLMPEEAFPFSYLRIMNKLQKNILVVAASMLALQGAAFAQSATQSNWYIGGSAGKSTVNPDISAVGTIAPGASEDKSSTGYKIFGGYQFNPNVAIEAAYQNLGKYTLSVPGANQTLKNQGLSVAAVGFLPLTSEFSLIGKAGVVNHKFKLDVNAPGVSISDKTTKSSLFVGFGAEYNLTPAVALRGEYEYFGKPDVGGGVKTKTDLLSVGVRYRF